MFGKLSMKQFSHLGALFDTSEGNSGSGPPANTYVAEDGTTPYVAEDGVTFYVTE